MDASQFFAKEKAIEKKIEEEKRAIKKNAEDKIKKRQAYEASFLCKKPFGQKDQCAWWITEQKCFRKRCNASGKWGDVTERPLNLEPRCAQEFNVGACDY